VKVTTISIEVFQEQITYCFYNNKIERSIIVININYMNKLYNSLCCTFCEDSKYKCTNAWATSACDSIVDAFPR